ncbi:MAG: Isoleucine-tRNA ligase [Candidatus Moranbacteria bacterium GW2011_GWE1_36_7]|nr:MAG: Isoleucine-tRNA ligase [Candidatus Moranbacteria bacterium GW2011_GWD2_36_12]KKQ07156.1 MAG: Isoleucine-tRNA ligase [Candidatus Moranbacteria bacterium GW2011_GWE2_36_40]KKQ11611.1 MAG: Isoleucine-tRNA ligase [Candidatus Moranbacteria bacterium GW2011_GWE1_36_7]
MFKKVDPKQSLPEMEKEILKFWEKEKIFEKSLDIRKDNQEYSFFDGPPFATGTPHYGHLVGSTMKDVVPRYWTMRGFHVERKWGWDCHGLPIENIVEKELGSKAKSDIEKMGIEKFNELCRSKVLKYVDEWKVVINRLGRWADMDNAYRTMDLSYMESVWWVFKELWDKGLIYEGYRSMHVCPRCETTLSQMEVSEGYQDIKDLSVTAKFELMDEPGVYVLAWTTTPWTLIGNVALAVNPEIEYVYVEMVNIENDGEFREEVFVVAKNRVADLFKDKKIEIVRTIFGRDLIGKKYKPLFEYYAKPELENFSNGWQVVGGDFVGAEDGTGVVHIAPAFGEDDLNLGKEKDLPFVQHVGMDGIIKSGAGEFSGLSVKPAGDHTSTDVEIIKHLAKIERLFAKSKYEHSYPHCWRCDTPLINYATSSWFVNVADIKPKALELAKEINWSPENIKEGRFGKWLEGARDWSISRQRFWASVIPVWRCECGEVKVFGSVSELEQASNQKIEDIHKHVVDKILVDCVECGKQMKRVPDVLDTWFDSGSMPYAQQHYPFENGEKFEKSFPAEFIAEGVDQTRAWFYYQHIIASAIKKSVAFKNVIVNGTVLAEDGKKMSKRLSNYPDPMLMFDKYGADSIRFYLMSSPVVAAQNLNFSEKDVAEFTRGPMRMLWNSYSFFVLYANIDQWKHTDYFKHSVASNLLDRWILSELNTLIVSVHDGMENYKLHQAARSFPKFIDDLSNWYVRRSRKRFWKSENDVDKNEAYATLHHVLVNLSKMMAPFAPFISEEIYKNLTGKESVHLADLPTGDRHHVDEFLNDKMRSVREIVTHGLQLRSQAKIKVRQPLSKVTVKEVFEDELVEIIKDELNVKEVCVDAEQEDRILLETEITEELALEGVAREIVRHIQEMRKEAGYDVDNHIKVCYNGQSDVFEKFGDLIAKETLSDAIYKEISEDGDLIKTIVLDGNEFLISIKR